MTIQNLITVIDEWAPTAYAEDFDNVGLLVGDARKECLGALITLDCTEDVMEEAINKKCNLIISFHPIVFSGLKKIFSYCSNFNTYGYYQISTFKQKRKRSYLCKTFSKARFSTTYKNGFTYQSKRMEFYKLP